MQLLVVDDIEDDSEDEGSVKPVKSRKVGILTLGDSSAQRDRPVEEEKEENCYS